jgi:D-ribulokinase
VTGLAIGIDVGTSGVRAAAVDSTGQCVADASVVLPPTSRKDARSTQQPAHWWRGVTTALDGVLKSIDRATVRAIAIDGTSGTVLGLDASDDPVGPARMYDDSDAADAVTRIARFAPLDSAAVSATSALARAMQLAAEPGVVRVLHQADWLAGMLSGRFDVSDENNALKTGYDPVRRRWPAWIDELGAVRATLPGVVPAGTEIGTVRAAMAERFGLAANVAVVAGTTDGCASFLATGATQPGDAATALGSTLVVKQLSNQPLFAPEFGLYSHRIGDLWLAGGASNSGGAVLLHYFSLDQLAALSGQITPELPSGLNYYPLIKAGERFPIADPALPPRLTPRPADDAQFLHGMLEGIAAIEKLAYDRLAGLGGPQLRSVRQTGGGARNTTWTQIRARVLGVPILSAVSDMAAVGAARLAWHGIGGRGIGVEWP